MGDSMVREVRELDELREVVRLYDEIRPHVPGRGLVPTVELMRVLSHTGNYVAGAYRDDRLVGAAVAFFGAPLGETLHAYPTGALPGSGVGFALKRHQRDWALARGLCRITWTFDPLVRRDAYVDLVELGARPEEYLPNLSGDAATGATDSGDRVLAVWRLDDPRVRAAAGETARAAAVTGVAEPAEPALVERAGRPVPLRTDAGVVRVAVPADIEALRRSDPEAAGAWRSALRRVLGGLLAAGAEVVDFDREGGYVVARRGHGPRPERPAAAPDRARPGTTMTSAPGRPPRR